ncbi:glycerophosphodiester phosphodiesterase family protein [uncultured Dokdonia sp.]|uniref:glycerophosphodiester phosphodiesterase family protein n=1 Tax=uncultured Dokdonia sp. TaxID=575653 RepID=UPI00262EC08E|nr:glycerophosphodiester phosphodiesterase family protein [uncultured Dokdonia sp.]
MSIIPTWLISTPIAHRGLHDGNHKIPENSLSAFAKAIKEKYPIELDVQIIKDGTVIVFHDADLKRACSNPKKTKHLRQEELTTHTLFKTTQTIPTLQEVLDFVNGQVPLLIELKTHRFSKKLEKNTLLLLKKYEGEVALQSFNRSSVKWLSKQNHNYPVGQLAEPSLAIQPLNYIYNYLQLNKNMRPDFVAYDIDDLTNKRVSYFKEKGVPILLWTVRNQAQIDRYATLFDNIIFEGFTPSLDHKKY